MTESVLMWITVCLYAVGSILYILGFVFARQKVMTSGLLVSLMGAVVHTVAVAVRWVEVGHAPFLGFYEVISGLVLMAIIALGAIALADRRLVALGVVLVPISLLMLGAAMLAPKTPLPVTPTLASWWLTIHITFAKLCYAAFMAAFALALAYLARDRVKKPMLVDVLAKLPAQEVVDDLTFKFVSAGFLFLGLMIAAGAVWANEAWGRYWGWDPIETWSLIAWLVYAVVLHGRLTLGWRGRKFAWAAVAALPVVLFSLIGVPTVYQSIHGAYLKGF